MKKTDFFAYMLIIAGVALLLYQFDIIGFTRFEIITAASLFLGILWFRKGMMHPQRSGILGGTFFTLLGVSLLLMKQYILPMEDSFGFGLVFVLLAIANLTAFVLAGRKADNIFAALIFLLAGGVFLSVYFDLISGWRMADLVSVFWPVLLIILGIFLVIEGFIKRTQ